MNNSIELIDTHAHVYDDKYADKDKIILDSTKKGIYKIFMPNINLETIQPSLEISKKYPNICYSMIGLHPCDVENDYKEKLSKLEQLFDINKFIAVGEIGLDKHWSTETLEIQKEAFKVQLKWAQKRNLPIVIHCRDAIEETLEILKNSYGTQKIRGIFHCFGGTLKEASRIIELGMLLGIGGVLTFRNSNLKNVLLEVPLESIVLETDSPYLAPVPHRGKLNEPVYLIYIAEALANIKNLDIKDIAKVTTQNALKFFKL